MGPKNKITKWELVVIVSASRPPPRPLDAQWFFGGAVLGCFLVLLLSRCFLSLSWVLSGTPSNSLGVFGTFLGSLLGLPWEPLGVSLGPSWPCWASWAALLAYPVLFWTLLGCSWASLFDPLGPRGGQAETRCLKKSPKRPPREQKWLPQNVNFMSFWGPFSNSLRDSFSEGFLDAWPLKTCDFAWEVLQKRSFPQVTSKSKERQKK